MTAIVTKAQLLELVESLPDDLQYDVYRDIGEVVRWMANPDREWHAGGTNERGEVANAPWWPKKRRYYTIFEPPEKT